MRKFSKHPDGGYLMHLEYGVRTIDANGDVVDIDHDDTLDAAIANATRRLNKFGALAAVVEREEWIAFNLDAARFWKAEGWTDEYDIEQTVVHVAGDAAALAAGNWTVAAE
jgi:hypothetical protein